MSSCPGERMTLGQGGGVRGRLRRGRGADRTAGRRRRRPASARLACIAASCSYAVGAIITRLAPPGPYLGFGAGGLLVAAASDRAAGADPRGAGRTLPPAAAVAGVLYLGIFPTALATVMLVFVVQSAGPSFMSLVNYQVPVWAVMLGLALPRRGAAAAVPRGAGADPRRAGASVAATAEGLRAGGNRIVTAISQPLRGYGEGLDGHSRTSCWLASGCGRRAASGRGAPPAGCGRLAWRLGPATPGGRHRSPSPARPRHRRRHVDVGQARVRLFGMDAPELDQYGGYKAKSHLIRLAGGRQVSVQPVDVDCYGRIVAVVRCGEVDLSRQMVCRRIRARDDRLAPRLRGCGVTGPTQPPRPLG